MNESSDNSPFSDEELKHIAKEKVLQSTGFRIHVLAYIGVNIGLFILNYLIFVFTGNPLVWFVYPAAGWLIGLSAHAAYYLSYSKGVSGNSIGLRIHATTYLVSNLSLFVINYFSNFTYMWFLWPTIFWGIGVIIHALAVRSYASSRNPDGERQSWLDRNIEKELQKAKKKSGGA